MSVFLGDINHLPPLISLLHSPSIAWIHPHLDLQSLLSEGFRALTFFTYVLPLRGREGFTPSIGLLSMPGKSKPQRSISGVVFVLGFPWYMARLKMDGRRLAVSSYPPLSSAPDRPYVHLSKFKLTCKNGLRIQRPLEYFIPPFFSSSSAVQCGRTDRFKPHGKLSHVTSILWTTN